MTGMLPDAVRIYRRGSISEGLHPTLLVPALEAAKVGNARQLSSYERQKQHRPRRSRIHCVHEFVVRFATFDRNEVCQIHPMPVTVARLPPRFSCKRTGNASRSPRGTSTDKDRG